MAGRANGEYVILDDDEDDLFESDLEQSPVPVPKCNQLLKTNINKKASALVRTSQSTSEGEHFDLDVTSSGESR
jgi:hypothetical protein